MGRRHEHERRHHRHARRSLAAGPDFPARTDRGGAWPFRAARIRRDRWLALGAENVRSRAVSVGERLFALRHPIVHSDGRRGRTRQDGDRAVPGLQRRLLRSSWCVGERDHWCLRAVRRDLRLFHRARCHLFPGCHPGDAPAWLRLGIRRGRSRLGRHPRRPDPALRVDRDLCHRRGAVAGPALCGGLHPGLRACRSLRGDGVDRRAPAARLDPQGQVQVLALRHPSPRGGGQWNLGVLFFFAGFGIYLGWFSPTEAAAMAAFVAILIAFATGAMRWRGLIECMLETVYTTAAIFFIVVGAFIFSRFIVLTQFPNELTRWVESMGFSWFWIVMAVMALYVLLGTFLDEVSTILITVPVTLPLMNSIGYDGVWFGIFVTVMCTIGLISPPTGMTVFVIQAQHPEIPVMRIYMGTLPFLVADFVLVALLMVMPSLALWLPRVLG